MVDSGGLENRCTREGTGGSNPSASAEKLVSEIPAFFVSWALYGSCEIDGFVHFRFPDGHVCGVSDYGYRRENAVVLRHRLFISIS